MDFSHLEIVILQAATTVLLTVAVIELVMHRILGLWTSVKHIKFTIETKSGSTITVAVNPDSEESVRQLLNAVAESDKESQP